MFISDVLSTFSSPTVVLSGANHLAVPSAAYPRIFPVAPPAGICLLPAVVGWTYATPVTVADQPSAPWYS